VVVEMGVLSGGGDVGNGQSGKFIGGFLKITA